MFYMFYVQSQNMFPNYTERDSLSNCCRLARQFLFVQIGVIGQETILNRRTSRDITVYLNEGFIHTAFGFSAFCDWVLEGAGYKNTIGRPNSFLKKVVVSCNNFGHITNTQLYFVLDQQFPIEVIYTNQYLSQNN